MIINNNPLFARLAETAVSRGWRRYKDNSVVAELNCSTDVDPSYKGLKLTFLSEDAISLEIHSDIEHLRTISWSLAALQRRCILVATGQQLKAIVFASLEKLEGDIMDEIKTIY